MFVLRTGLLLPLAFEFLLLAATAGEPNFSRDIQPLLADHCYACGPDSRPANADSASTSGRWPWELNSGARAIVPGSRRKVNYSPHPLRRPGRNDASPDFRKRLSESDKTTLSDWVEAGATYEQHWAFVPATSHLPPVRDRAGPAPSITSSSQASRSGTWAFSAGKPTLAHTPRLGLRGLPTLGELTKHSGGTNEEGRTPRRNHDRLPHTSEHGPGLARPRQVWRHKRLSCRLGKGHVALPGLRDRLL